MPAKAESARPFGNRCSYPIASTFSQTGCPSAWFALVGNATATPTPVMKWSRPSKKTAWGISESCQPESPSAGTGFDMEAPMEGARQRDADDPDGGRQRPR